MDSMIFGGNTAFPRYVAGDPALLVAFVNGVRFLYSFAGVKQSSTPGVKNLYLPMV
jgi:hypothetical protein